MFLFRLFKFGLVGILLLLYMLSSSGSSGRSYLIDATKRAIVTTKSSSYLDEFHSKSSVLSLSDGSMVANQVYEYAVNGFAATISGGLSEDPKDHMRRLSNTEDIFDDSAPTSGHWGLCRINETIWSLNNAISDTCYSSQFLGKNVDIYVIDTGTMCNMCIQIHVAYITIKLSSL